MEDKQSLKHPVVFEFKQSNLRTLPYNLPDHLITTATDALLQSSYQAKPLELFLAL